MPDLYTQPSPMAAPDPRAEHGAMLKAQLDDAERRVAEARRTLDQWQPVAHACAAGLAALQDRAEQDEAPKSW